MITLGGNLNSNSLRSINSEGESKHMPLGGEILLFWDKPLRTLYLTKVKVESRLPSPLGYLVVFLFHFIVLGLTYPFGI